MGTVFSRRSIGTMPSQTAFLWDQNEVIDLLLLPGAPRESQQCDSRGAPGSSKHGGGFQHTTMMFTPKAVLTTSRIEQ